MALFRIEGEPSVKVVLSRPAVNRDFRDKRAVLLVDSGLFRLTALYFVRGDGSLSGARAFIRMCDVVFRRDGGERVHGLRRVISVVLFRDCFAARGIYGYIRYGYIYGYIRCGYIHGYIRYGFVFVGYIRYRQRVGGEGGLFVFSLRGRAEIPEVLSAADISPAV